MHMQPRCRVRLVHATGASCRACPDREQDLGFNDVGYNNRTAAGTVGGRGIISPNIDRLCDEGVRLVNYYVQEMCTPTRAALMTGRYPFRYGLTAYTIGAEEPWGIPVCLNLSLANGLGWRQLAPRGHHPAHRGRMTKTGRITHVAFV